MKVIIALLIVALSQYASGAHISSCAEEIDHTTDSGSSGDMIKLDTDYYLRALVPDYEFNAAGFQCIKVKYSKDAKGDRLANSVGVFNDFTLNVTRKQSVVAAGDVVPGKAGNLMKNVIVAYDFLHDDDFFQHEERLRYPGVAYSRTLYVDENIHAFWECDRHAPVSKEANDNRFFFSKGADESFTIDHPAYKQFDENKGDHGFEGKLELLTKEQIKKCADLQFKTNF